MTRPIELKRNMAISDVSAEMTRLRKRVVRQE
jgi:hypothetical protein